MAFDTKKEWETVDSVIKYLRMEYDESVTLGGVFGRMSAEIKRLEKENESLKKKAGINS